MALCIIFIGAVMDPIWRNILRLSMWVGILGFIRIFSLLSKDRFDNLTTVAYTSPKQYYKVTGLLGILFMCSILWYLGSIILFPNSLIFLTLELLPVVFDTVQTMTKYFAHLIDQWKENGLESKRIINYYAELSADILILGCTLLQYLQLLWTHGISFGLVDIVLLLNVRSVLKNLYSKLQTHHQRWRAMSYVKSRYVYATSAEIAAYNDDCAICCDKMKTAKKLSCGHLFHL
ncbi:hypothetical protein BDF14DRAFT_1873210 [Spinellus fusiger]|nr:hypothetical protein BDF14DRAFT_1873210 [Spinellus fusiger]